MSTTAVLLVLLSAAFHFGWNYLTKSSSSPKAFSLLKGTVFIGISLCVLPALPVSRIPGPIWSYIVVSGVIHALYIYALTTSYESGDMSFVYPISRSAPALVPVPAYLIFGETVSLRGVAGIAIVVVSVFLIQLRGDGSSQLRRLYSSLKQRDSIWAFVTLASVVAYTLVDKAAMVDLGQVDEIPDGTRALLFFMLEGSICYLIFWLYAAARRGLGVRAIARKEWRRALAGGIGMLVSYGLILHVMQDEPVSYIVTLRQSSILLAVLVGSIGLRESYGRFRLLLAGAMLCGLALVATA